MAEAVAVAAIAGLAMVGWGELCLWYFRRVDQRRLDVELSHGARVLTGYAIIAAAAVATILAL